MIKIKMLWGQRVCQYPGQYAPELLLAVDENCDDDNPTYFTDGEKMYKSSEEFSSLVTIEGNISDVQFEKAFKKPIVDVDL